MSDKEWRTLRYAGNFKQVFGASGISKTPPLPLDLEAVKAVIAKPQGTLTPEDKALLAQAMGASRARPGLSWIRFHGRGRCPFPDKYFTCLRYVESYIPVQSNVVANRAYQTSLRDPYYTTGGAAANYFNAMGQYYLNYYVRAARFSVKFMNPTDSQPATSVCIFATLVPPGTMNATWGNIVPDSWDGILEWPVAKKIATAGALYSGKPWGNVSLTLNVSDFVSAPLDPAQFAGRTNNSIVTQTATDPATMVYMGMVAYAADGFPLTSYPNCRIMIDYDCEFYNPVYLSTNTVDNEASDDEDDKSGPPPPLSQPPLSSTPSTLAEEPVVISPELLAAVKAAMSK